MTVNEMKPEVEVVSCLVCHMRLANVRGLCWTHYQVARTQIKKGNTTWEKLIAEGKALPSKALSKKVKE